MFLQGFAADLALLNNNIVVCDFLVYEKRRKKNEFQKEQIVTAVQIEIKQFRGNTNNNSLLVIECNKLKNGGFLSLCLCAEQFEKVEESRPRTILE